VARTELLRKRLAAHPRPSTPIHTPSTTTVQTRDATGEPEPELEPDIDDEGNDDDDEEVVMVSEPQRKKRKTARTTRNNPPQTPGTPPRCIKTKKETLTSTISHEAAAELIGPASETVDSPPTDTENDADVSDGEEGEWPAADQSDQTMHMNDGE
jgi:hypothetical protein